MNARRAALGTRYRWLIAFAATALCLAAAVHFVDLGSSAAILASSDPLAWGATLALSIAMAILRALRVITLDRSASAWPLIKASFLHNAANALLPAKIGDAALPIALKRYAGLSLTQGVGMLLLVRLSDLATLAGLGIVLVGIVDLWMLPPVWRILVMALGAALCLGPAVLPFAARGGGRWVERFAGDFGARVAAAAARLGSTSGIRLAFFTLAIWVTLALAGRSAVAAVGLDMNWTLTSLACVAASFAFASPVNGIANAGPFEAAFAGVLAFGDAPIAQAVAAALVLHLSALVGAGLTAFVAWGSPTAKSAFAPWP